MKKVMGIVTGVKSGITDCRDNFIPNAIKPRAGVFA